AAAVLGAVYDINLAFAALATVFAYGVFTLTVTEWRVKQRRRLNEADTELKARAIDSLTNFETVKAFAAEERETSRYDAALQSYNVRYVETSRSLSLMNAGQELIMNIGLLSVAGLAAWGAYQGRLGVGDVTAVVLMLSNLYRPLNILGWAWREIKQGGVDLEKLYGLLGMAAEVTDRPDAKPLTIANGEVRFEGVGFSHADRSAGLIDVDFVAPGGGKLALVGASGSGKSTLLKLLFRFYDVQRGRVSIDGQNVGDVTQSSLRNALGLVPQDVVLFNTTIADNISYAKPDATRAELIEAARRAQLLEFIEGLPQGWETRVGERGVKLSGGEKQRLGIARAILKDPPILVLDEATSALDSGTEEDVQQALNAASHGRTTLVVAHRLSTIADADEIIVLDAGRVVERGDHQSLIAKDGAYAKMWERQAKNSDQSVVETAAQ
ncbi:MAG: ATP-binding cassette domain-containing protein, partial [Pseudomonadota bacterium]